MPKGKFLTLEDRKKIVELLDQNKVAVNIAEILERSVTCINREIKKNGGIRTYDAEKAHLKAEEVMKKRAISVSKAYQNRYIILVDKLDLMRSHIDILFDEIKKIKEQIK